MASNIKIINSDEISDSQTSSLSSSRKSVPGISNSRYRWPSRWVYISTVMAFTCSLNYFDAFLMKENNDGVSLFHYIIAYSFVGLPLYYLQILLGQYTQMGISLMRYISPVGHGIAISYILTMLIQCVKNGVLLADATLYFLSSMRDELQWMKCPINIQNICWNGTRCNRNCISDTMRPSTYYYFIEIFMERIDINDTTSIIGIPTAARTVLITSSWVITCLILVLTYARRQCFVILWHISLSLILLNAFTGMVSGYGYLIVKYAVRISTSTLVDLPVWARAIRKPICYLALGRAFHIMHGSYIAPTASSGIMASCLLLFNFIILYMCSIFVRCKMFALQNLAHLDKDHAHLVWNPGILSYFVYIPQSLGLMRVEHFWTVQYFLLCILLLLNNQITHIIMLEITLSEYHPALIRYRKYVLGGIALIAGLISICLSAKESYLLYHSICFNIACQIETLNVAMLSVLVCYIYGVQKFSDDVHFMSGMQPSNFWKFCWYCLPILLCMSYHYSAYYNKPTTDLISSVERWIFYILLSPVPIVALMETLRYIRRRNILGLFQSEELYGPPDPRERYLRRLFNPRQETRSQRKTQICYHRCLLNSKILKKATEQELEYKRSFATP